MRLLLTIFIALVSFTIVYGKGGLQSSDPETRGSGNSSVTERNSGVDVQEEFFKDGFNLNLYIGYTYQFRARFPENTDYRIKSIVGYLQTFMADDSLGAPINIRLVGTGFWRGLPAYTRVDTLRDDIHKRVSEPLSQMMTHFVLLHYSGGWPSGFSNGRTACNGARYSAIVVYAASWGRIGRDYATAKHIAYHIGNTLGFQSDLSNPLGTPRDDKGCGPSHIMNGKNYVAKTWSGCSRKDFLKFYRNNEICLTPSKCRCYDKGSYDDDNSCNNWLNVCACKPGYFGAHCDRCWPGVRNIGTPGAPECDCFMDDTDLYGGDLKITKAGNAKLCQKKCKDTKRCEYFTFSKSTGECWLKGAKKYERHARGVVYGPKFCSFGKCLKQDLDLTMRELTSIAVRKDSKQVTEQACQHSCVAHPACEYWTLNKNNKVCSLKSIMAFARPKPGSGLISGPKRCPGDSPIFAK